jgi:hypothetical protein
MKFARSIVTAVFFILVAVAAFASPLAKAAPEAALLVSFGLAWGGALLISPVEGERLGDSVAPLQFAALSVASQLKLDKIMRTGLRALKRRLSPVLALSTVFRDQPLTETDTVQVPYYPLETTTSRQFDGSYNFAAGDAVVNALPVTVDQRPYQWLEFTSKELARNSVVDLGKILALKIEKLAEDVLNDIFSLVTVANYGAAILDTTAANFDISDLVDLRTALTGVQWPKSNRSLDSTYEGALLKPQLQVYAAGTDAALREGAVGRLAGFDIFDHPGMPTNAEKLAGCAILPYAILVAFAPVPPADEVRMRMSDYRAYTDPDTNLTLEYRAFGDPESDSVKQTIEVNYGKAKGDTAQLKRITNGT